MASSLQSASIALAALLLFPSVFAATPMYKCETNGSVQYQQSPCPPQEVRKQPTVDELNAERRKKLAVAKESTQPAPSFKCDGRKICSQMTSCAEAMYFLANCPGVKMDGDHNGLPCEMQWCTR